MSTSASAKGPTPSLSGMTTVDLTTIVIDTTGWTQEKLKTEAGELFHRHCVSLAKFGRVRTHDGEEVRIFERDVEHAFRTSKDRRGFGWKKDAWDEKRVQRVQWIVPVIAGHVDRTGCYLVVDHTSPDKPPPRQRLYVAAAHQYVVWLQESRNGWTFRSAYQPTWDDIRRYTSGNPKKNIAAPELIWSR